VLTLSNSFVRTLDNGGSTRVALEFFSPFVHLFADGKLLTAFALTQFFSLVLAIAAF